MEGWMKLLLTSPRTEKLQRSLATKYFKKERAEHRC
ncbi:hypothetical protein COLO4_03026 [Corchorus olitorius]|uniref:Uncharacterized protein n=1 Tax=Corchorus olitorius TaxID=93759 RepID=A0A1R3KZU3_9ROSI|nr:hypothetical protein COLO4_03026 [Corchorus olitorius]